MSMLDDLAGLLLNRLLWTSLQAVLLVGFVALIVRWVPRLPATVRSALWWLIALQVVIGLCWQAPVRLPLLASRVATFTEHLQGPAAPQGHLVKPSGAAPQPAKIVGWKAFLTWRNGLAILWLLGLLAQMPAMARDRRRMRVWLQESDAPDDCLRRRSEELSRKLGLRRRPRLRVSSAITSPLVAGWVRPVILWPARSAFTREETSLALAHELAHLKRGDLWLACIPAIAQCLFFFHPFVRASAREYAMHREAACDALAMRVCGANTSDYGRLLLRLGVSGLRATVLAGASATFRGLKRRLLMLPLAAAPAPRVRGWLLVALIAAIGVLPYRVVAASPPTIIHVKAGVGPHGNAASSPGHCNGVGADDIRFCGANFLVYTGAAPKGQGAVLFDTGKVIIAGVHADVVAASQFYRTSARLLWFRRDGQAYVVRDPTILQRAHSLVVRASDSVRKGEALDGRVGKLTALRDKLVDDRGNLVAQRDTLVAERRKLVHLRAGASNARRRQQIDARVHTQQAEIDALQRNIDAQQSKIDALQRSLDAQRAEDQTRRAASSDMLARVSRGLIKLADDAIATGAAREVDR